MQGPRSGQPRVPGTTLSLGNLLASLKVDVQCALHNSGNDAFMCLFALQKLLDPDNTAIPEMKGKPKRGSGGISRGGSSGLASPIHPSPSTMPRRVFSGYAMATPTQPAGGSLSPAYSGAVGKAQGNGYLAPADEFGLTRRLPGRLDRRSSAISDGEGNMVSMATSGMRSVTLG
jgi:hypothetical protein